MKKCYAIWDVTKNDIFDETYETLDEAVKAAEYDLAHMTKNDLKRRIQFAIYKGSVDEDGVFDINSADLVKKYI